MSEKRIYNQLTLTHRKLIEKYLISNYKISFIARKLGFDRSTISREIKRNQSRTGQYHPVTAHKTTKRRQSLAYKNQRLTIDMKKTISELIEEDWSPEQITCWCKLEKIEMVSHETIYKYVKNKHHLFKHLRHSKKRRKKYGSNRISTIKNRKNISERPKIVENKSRIGDFEIDTIVGAKHKGAIVTIVDRKSKYLLAKQINYNTAKNVELATIELLKPYKNKLFTITSDNGKEFTNHEEISKKLDCDFYFADPYSSWQRGLNENTNGLLRQYFPKGISLRNIDRNKLNLAINKINNRPRKTLQFKTPESIFKYNNKDKLNLKKK